MVKNLPANAGDQGPEFWPGKSHGQRSLVGHSPWGHKRVEHDLETKKKKILKYNIYSYILYIP